MFGKSKKKPEDLEQEVFKTRIALQKVKRQYEVMLERELRTARYLKSKGMKSASNYSKIGMAYYLIQIVDTASARLSDITTTRELNEAMGSLSQALGRINQLSSQTGKADGKSLLSQVQTLQRDSAREEKQLAAMLGSLSGAGTSREQPSMENLAGMDVIENLINGSEADGMALPKDAVPITPSSSEKPKQENTVLNGFPAGEAENSGSSFDELDPEEVNRCLQALVDQI